MSDDLDSVLDSWRVRPIAPIARATSGTMNETFLVPTATGPVVLRRHQRTDRREIEHEHQVIAHAIGRGLPVPAILVTAAGERLVEHGGRFYSLFAHAPGTQVTKAELTPPHAHAMGTMLARLHLVLADFDSGAAAHSEPSAASPATAARVPVPTRAATLRRLRDLLAEVERREQGPDERLAAGQLRGWVAWWEANAGPRLPDPPGADTTQPIHGDFQETNLFFEGERIVAVIDWDRARHHCRAEEVVRTWDLSFQLRPALCTAFLAGYRTLLELTSEQLDAAAARYGFSRLHAPWLHETIYLRGENRLRVFLRAAGPGFTPFPDSWAILRGQLA
ncbi:phosphotransferase [Actinopolymorpha pittospori]|uniref:Homoserine kinase type II n=1 Tax=Actinopolymorpha pittospori TaxID=648752 RepID=A0A927N206_9ACTN|nr:phosphotransferase [Actinopolymorpha pittospori]MBE1610589.1 homoserine kinase type II [Actinopolymorpha pittospori]